MMLKEFEGTKGKVKAWTFSISRRTWVVAVSESRWDAGHRYKKMPIWFSKRKGRASVMFVWKVAIGYAGKGKYY